MNVTRQKYSSPKSLTSRLFFSILIAVALFAATGLVTRRTASAISSAATETIISTIAGGGFGSEVPARQAPMVLPTAVVLDPRGRGFYVVDEVDGTSLLRFVSTSSVPIMLSGVTIQPGNINLIAGGGVQSNDGISPLDSDLAQITGLAVDPSGDAVYMTIPSFSAIRAINVGAQNLTVSGKTIVPGTISTVAAPDQAIFRAAAIHPTTREIHFIAGRLVLKLNSSGGQVLVAGGGNPQNGNGDGGLATLARLTAPTGLAFDTSNNLLIADGGDARTIQGSVRRVNSTGTIASLAGGLEYPTGITTAPNGDVYVALGNAQQIVRITSTGVKTVITGNQNMQLCDPNNTPTCGDGGPALQASLNIPDSTANTTLGIAVDGRGLFIPDFRYKRIRFVTLSGGTQTILGTTIPLNAINTIVGSGTREMFVVRRIVGGEGVERKFPLHSPKIAKIEVKRSGVVRRAKLYYLRDRVGKAVRLKERRDN
jgi:hypothetical protein